MQLSATDHNIDYNFNCNQ